MRIFVTGASGNIGSATVSELISAGHEVVGLARSEASAAVITALGATPLAGSLGDRDALREGAHGADAVINLAFSADFANLGPGIVEEANTVTTIGDVLAGTGKAFVHAGGTPFVPGRASTEEDAANTQGPMGGRSINANAVIALADRGVRSSVVRLPRSVHLRGSGYGFASALIANAQRTGVSAYIGDGSQRWPAVHRLDAASLFRVAVEDAPAGTVLHAVGDEGDTMLSLAKAIGRVLAAPVEQVPGEHFGPLAGIYAIDQPSSSEVTRARFGWTPTHPTLIDDLEAGDYPDLGGWAAGRNL
jgi:nucleoside-diphosphate-sugar epimerase